MAIFSKKSRYALYAETYQVTDRRGRKVVALTVPPKPVQEERGEHLMREGQRLDHLASYYLKDPAGFWRICELNDVMLPDALAEVQTVKIPTVL